MRCLCQCGNTALHPQVGPDAHGRIFRDRHRFIRGGGLVEVAVVLEGQVDAALTLPAAGGQGEQVQQPAALFRLVGADLIRRGPGRSGPATQLLVLAQEFLVGREILLKQMRQHREKAVARLGGQLGRRVVVQGDEPILDGAGGLALGVEQSAAVDAGGGVARVLGHALFRPLQPLAELRVGGHGRRALRPQIAAVEDEVAERLVGPALDLRRGAGVGHVQQEEVAVLQRQQVALAGRGAQAGRRPGNDRLRPGFAAAVQPEGAAGAPADDQHLVAAGLVVEDAGDVQVLVDAQHVPQ